MPSTLLAARAGEAPAEVSVGNSRTTPHRRKDLADDPGGSLMVSVLQYVRGESTEGHQTGGAWERLGLPAEEGRPRPGLGASNAGQERIGVSSARCGTPEHHAVRNKLVQSTAQSGGPLLQ